MKASRIGFHACCFVGLMASVVAAAACSSSSSSGTTADGGGTSGGLQAPMLQTVEPMAGALHVTWMNMENDCDSVEGERKTGTGNYASAFSVPGSVDNKMDTAATQDMTYTYRLRCKKGNAYSDYSNEMGGNPMQAMDGGMDGMAMDAMGQ